MKKSIFILLLLLVISFSSLAQDLNSYQYVRIPNKFEFQKSENQYQVNALTAFLFEKFGFESLYKKQAPAGTPPCVILDANVIDESGLFTTKVYVTLKNCRDELVFTSQTGSSKEKDFQKAFNEALREAFKSVEALKHEYEVLPQEVVIEPSLTKKEKAEPSQDTVQVPVVVVDPVITSEEKENFKTRKEEREEQPMPPEDSIYVNGSEEYMLKETVAGIQLLKVGSEEKPARLVRSNGGDFFHYLSEKVNGIAYFDREGALVVEYLEPVAGQMVTLVFQKKDQ